VATATACFEALPQDSDEQGIVASAAVIPNEPVPEAVVTLSTVPSKVLGKRLIYDGDSDRTQRRRRYEDAQAHAACPMQTLTAHWRKEPGPPTTTSTPPVSLAARTNSACIAELKGLLASAQSNTSHFLKLLVLLKFFEARTAGSTRAEAADIAATSLPSDMQYSCRTVHNWARTFLESGVVAQSHRGKHQKSESLLHDEDFLAQCIKWLRETLPSKRTPQHFRRHLVDTVLPLVTGLGAKSTAVCETTARNWMLSIGYKFGAWRKDVFIDGHERADVVEQRKAFCSAWLDLSRRMLSYSGESMDVAVLPEDTSEPEVVWVTHDESVFYANDDGGHVWSCKEHPDLPKKSRGRSIMISDFLCPCHGRLFEIVEGEKVFVTETLHVGKAQEGFWTSAHVVEQVTTKALPAFALLHPNAVALFTFDQSTNHAAFASDALRSSMMNLGIGGKQPLLRPGWFGSERTPQAMSFPPTHSDPALRGVAKGLKIVLAERGFNVDAMRLRCGNEVDLSVSDEILECCARHCMASQPDFRAQKSILEETIVSQGHMCLFFPKYHCELNPIEAYWGSAKRHARASCDYSWSGLVDCVPKSLGSVSLSSIRKYFRRCSHFIESYSYGCDYTLTRFAHKKYKSHRRIPMSVLQEK